MNSLNSILVEGNLTRDPELTYTPKGTACCKFAIAVNRSYKEGEEYKQEVSYFDICTWARLAEVCGEYLKKGRGVRVVGRLKQDRWEKDGQMRSRVFIQAERCEFRPDGKKKDPDGEAKEEPKDATSEPPTENIPF